MHDLTPPELWRRWKDAGYCPGTDIYSLFEDQVSAHPDHVAVIDDAGETTYAQLAEQTARLAAALVAAGIRPGEIVATQLQNRASTIAVELAIVAVGAACLPFAIQYREKEVEGLLGGSGAAMVIVESDPDGFDAVALMHGLRGRLPALRSVAVANGVRDSQANVLNLGDAPSGSFTRVAVDPYGPCRITVSSGTESTPKMAVWSHQGLVGGAANVLTHIGMDDARVHLLVPLSSGMGVHGSISLMARHGQTVVVSDTFNAAHAVELVERHDVTHVIGVPTMFAMMLDVPGVSERDFSSLRVMLGAGAAFPEALYLQLTERFQCAVLGLWGSTDGGSCINDINDSPDRFVTTTGRPDPALTDIRIVDEHENDLPPGAIGDIRARGPNMPMCYLNAPDLDAKYRTEDGWVRTGDLGMIDADGYLCIAGRSKDIIIRGGMNISPLEIEELIVSIPGVQLAACVAMPDERFGERVCAFIAPTVDADRERFTVPELGRILGGKGLAKTKFPERVELIEDMPLNPSGKVDKSALRELVAKIIASDASNG